MERLSHKLENELLKQKPPKIDLIYPPSTSGSENYSSEPPLGPIALFSSLPNAWRDNTRFLDSTLISQQEIVESILERKPDIVGISCTTFNYRKGLEIAEIVKANGGVVIFGGIHITHMSQQILGKMERGERDIDYLLTLRKNYSFDVTTHNWILRHSYRV